MISGGILEKSIGYNNPRISSHGYPFSIKNVIFDLGKDVKYDYFIFVVTYNLSMRIWRDNVVFFNKEMSFDLYEALTSDIYSNKITKLFMKRRIENNMLIGYWEIDMLAPDLLLNYMQTYIETPIGSYESAKVYFNLNNREKYEHIKKIYKLA